MVEEKIDEIPTHRRRSAYALLVLVVIALGLATRRFPEFIPTVFSKYPGDALWSLMVMLIAGWLFRSKSTAYIAIAALGISFAVEVAQLIQWPWLVELRRTKVGHLVLGSTFNWPDFLAYTCGVAFGVVGEFIGRLVPCFRRGLFAQLPRPSETRPV